MENSGRFRRRLVIGLVIAALVLFGWTYLRTHGLLGDKPKCEAAHNVERDPDGKVTAITHTVCIDD
ncbi:hypothetical protein KY084_00830 [Stakelama sp. CBK3Z-3]|uniref:Uncharacterized protein n=1 Tax=Stakelama flava TaxID=2860338 RepID=A0ABS6XGT3_9SPHN|nr:hypothetical protein [Stakelama flava]MBW4329422.1 hypothetical protein [Stakelama flava]